MTNLTDGQVYGLVTRWVASITAQTTIKARPEGDPPAEPYIMVNLTGNARIHDNEAVVDYTDTGNPNSEGENEISAAPLIETEWRFSVHCYGPDAMQILRPLRSAARLAQKIELIHPLVVHDTGPDIRDLSEVVNEKWQERANMDLIIRGYTRDGFVIDVIDDASFTHTRA